MTYSSKPLPGTRTLPDWERIDLLNHPVCCHYDSNSQPINPEPSSHDALFGKVDACNPDLQQSLYNCFVKRPKKND